MHAYKIFCSLSALLQGYDCFGYGSHNPERSFAAWVELYCYHDCNKQEVL